MGQQSRSPSLCLIFTRRLLSLSRDCDRRRNWPQTELRQKVLDAKSKKVSGRRFKTRSVGLVEAETFFCLALIGEYGPFRENLPALLSAGC